MAIESRRGRLSGSQSRLDFFRTRGLYLGRNGVTPHTTHNGQRPVEEILGYNLNISYQQYWERYERGGITLPLIEMVAEDTWNRGFEIIEDPDMSVITPLEQAARELFTRLKAQDKLLRADILARIGEFSVLLVGAPPKELHLPIGRSLTANDIKFLHPYGQDRVTIKEWDEDVESERFNLPLMYTIDTSPEGKIGTLTSNKRDVHYSRIIHICNKPIKSDLFGTPALRPVWGYLDDLLKVTGGGSEAAWRRMDPGLHVDVDPTIEMDEEDEEDLENQLLDYEHGKSKIVQTYGSKLEPINVSVANFGPNAKPIIQLIAATERIPYRKLLGNEQGEQSSTDDRDTYDKRLRDRKSSFAAGCVQRLTDLFIYCGALPQADSYIVAFGEGDTLTEGERADAASKIAAANKHQVDAGQGVIMTSNEIRAYYYQKDPLDTQSDDDGEVTDGEKADSQRENLAAGGEELGMLTLAVSHESAIIKAFRAVLASKSVKSAVASLDMDKIEAAVETQIQGPFNEACLKVYSAAANDTYKKARGKASYLAVTARFDAANERVIAWVSRNSARLVTEVGQETVLGIWEFIRTSQERGLGTREIKKQLANIVGLRSDQVNAIDRLRNRLANARPGSTIKAGSKRIVVPKVGATPAFIDRHAAAYADRLLDNRLRLIARTETLRAANAGQQEMWLQARDAGDLPADAKRVWIVTDDDRLRDEHAALADEVTGIDEPFSGGFEPGQPPNCRCTQGLTDD